MTASTRRPPRPGCRVGAAAAVVVEPERNFPVPVVIAHGVCAVTTYALVLTIMFRTGGI